MKKKLTAFIIGAAIWFGMADAARQMDYLQSEASDLVAKTSIYLFSLGREDAPELKDAKTIEPIIAYETENALAAETEESFPSGSKRTNANLKQESVRVENHSLAKTSEKAVMKKDVDELIALADEIDREVHSQRDEGDSLVAIETEKKRHSALQRAVAVQRIAEKVGREYGEKSSFNFDLKVLKSSNFPTPKAATVCPTIVSPEKLKVKTIVLMPEVLKQFGE